MLSVAMINTCLPFSTNILLSGPSNSSDTAEVTPSLHHRDVANKVMLPFRSPGMQDSGLHHQSPIALTVLYRPSNHTAVQILSPRFSLDHPSTAQSSRDDRSTTDLDKLPRNPLPFPLSSNTDPPAPLFSPSLALSPTRSSPPRSSTIPITHPPPAAAGRRRRQMNSKSRW